MTWLTVCDYANPMGARRDTDVTLLDSGCDGTLAFSVAMSKGASRKMETYRSSSIHNRLSLIWVRMKCNLWARGPSIRVYIVTLLSMFLINISFTSSSSLQFKPGMNDSIDNIPVMEKGLRTIL